MGEAAPFCAIYRWRLHPGTEEAFVRHWSRVTQLLRSERGSLGSRLHRGPDEVWHSYTQWPSAAFKAEALARPSVDAEAWALMRACIAESLPELVLEPVADFLAPLSAPASPAAALVVIDMQRGMARPGLPARNNPQAEARIAELLATWRAAGAPVVHVRHLSRTPGSPFWPGQPGAEFQPALAPLDAEHVVEKNVPDAFVNTGLERWLHQRGIAALVIVGVSTNNSVESTARTAGNLGFAAHVAADATFAFATRDFHGAERSADEVHAMALGNLEGEYAKVRAAAELKRLAARPDPGAAC